MGGKKLLYAALAVLSVVLFLGAAFGLQYYDDMNWSKQVGEACTQRTECRGTFPRHYCVVSWDESAYCTNGCETDADCRPNWKCERSEVDIDLQRGKHLRPGFVGWDPDSNQDHIQTCRRPGVAKPVDSSP